MLKRVAERCGVAPWRHMEQVHRRPAPALAEAPAGRGHGGRRPADEDPRGEGGGVPHGGAEPEDRPAGAGRGFGATHGGDRQRPVEGRRFQAVAVRAAALAGGAAVRVRGGEAAGADRGQREVDLEHRRGTVPERHPHCRHPARLAAAVGGRARRARRRRAALPGVVGKGLRGALGGTRVGDVPRELRRHAGDPVADQAVGYYFENNRGRMRYPRHLAMGLLTGSGVVRKLLRHTGRRPLKRGGMHWSG